MTIELTFRDWDHYEPDGWAKSGEIITETSKLDLVRNMLSNYKILVIQHWHYRGAQAPNYVIVEDIEEFMDYLSGNAVAGDAIDVYDISEALKVKNNVASGKYPDKNNEIPSSGAY